MPLKFFIQEEWDVKFDGGTAIALILSFLWGSVLFIFKIATGIQVLVRVACDEDPSEKIYPLGQGIGAIRAFYMEHFKQLSVVLLISEIVSWFKQVQAESKFPKPFCRFQAINVHRSFNYPITAFLMEAEHFLDYSAPSEYGKDISVITITVNAIGLILITVVSFLSYETMLYLLILMEFWEMKFCPCRSQLIWGDHGLQRMW